MIELRWRHPKRPGTCRRGGGEYSALVLLPGDVAQRKIFQTFADLEKLRFVGAPKKHAGMRRVSEVEFAGGAVEGAGYDSGQAQWPVGCLDIESEFVVSAASRPAVSRMS